MKHCIRQPVGISLKCQWHREEQIGNTWPVSSMPTARQRRYKIQVILDSIYSQPIMYGKSRRPHVKRPENKILRKVFFIL